MKYRATADYVGPTDTRGARLRFRVAGKQRTVPVEYLLSLRGQAVRGLSKMVADVVGTSDFFFEEHMDGKHLCAFTVVVGE